MKSSAALKLILSLLLCLILAVSLTGLAFFRLRPATGWESGSLDLCTAAPASAAEAPVVDDRSESDFDGRIVEEQEGLTVTRVLGKTYRGYMAVIDDPDRVFVGVPDQFSEKEGGLLVTAMNQKYGSVLGVNGGGYSDPGGYGNGGTPAGIVITDGRLIFGDLYTAFDVIGIDYDGKLQAGLLTGQQCLDMGLRCAVSYGPTLIQEGEAVDLSGNWQNNTNPRTAIGQREDGAIILLTLDGRQIPSLGASFETLQELLLNAGCVTASNLDGGASTCMALGDRVLNVTGSINGPRRCVTCILVSSAEEAAG